MNKFRSCQRHLQKYPRYPEIWFESVTSRYWCMSCSDQTKYEVPHVKKQTMDSFVLVKEMKMNWCI